MYQLVPIGKVNLTDFTQAFFKNYNLDSNGRPYTLEIPQKYLKPTPSGSYRVTLDGKRYTFRIVKTAQARLRAYYNGILLDATDENITLDEFKARIAAKLTIESATITKW